MILDFRVWDKVEKRMRYNPMLRPSRIYEDYIVYGFSISRDKFPNNTEFFVETNEIMMNTQLEDFNGSPIYEGDKLYDVDDGYYYGVVEYDKEDGMYIVVNDTQFFSLGEINSTCEIIGTKCDTEEE